MRVTRGYMASSMYPMRGDGRKWNTPGAIVTRDAGPTQYHGSARHGIYVYTSEAEAIDRAWDCDHVVLKVLVSPTDLIHQSMRGRQTVTYEKVTVAEDQPWIDWVDA